MALGKIGWPYAEDAVVDYLSNRDSPEYVRALAALGHIGGPRAEAFLCSVVDDESRSRPERKAALVSLARMRSPRAVGIAARLYDVGFAEGAPVILAHVGGAEAIRALQARYAAAKFDVRINLHAAHMRHRQARLGQVE